MSDLLKYHQWCISDSVLMPAYSEAIKRLVRPGDVLFDLGAGTGILGMLACAAGAARVDAVDPSEIVALIPEIAAANGYSDRIVVHQMLSYDFQPSDRADIVIASMQGTAGIGNDLLRVAIDARERLLKPGGVLIPFSIQPSFSPVELPEWYASRIDCWNESRLGLTFRSARAYAVNRTTSLLVDKVAVLAAPKSFPEIRFTSLATPNVAAELTFDVERDGILHALAGWAKVTTAEGVAGSSSPLEEKRMPWDHLILPMESPVPVHMGDRVQATIQVNMAGQQPVTQWNVRVREDVEFRHSSFRGMLLTKSDLEKAAAPRQAPQQV